MGTGGGSGFDGVVFEIEPLNQQTGVVVGETSR